jgi:hypothetical protein
MGELANEKVYVDEICKIDYNSQMALVIAKWH